MDPKDLPPPKRAPKTISLKRSMAQSAIKEAKANIEKSLSSIRTKIKDQAPSNNALKAMEERLLQLQIKTINERELLKETKESLQAKEASLLEREAILEAREKFVESRYESMPDKSNDPVSPEERNALESLRLELERREHTLKEIEELLVERESYIEECENELVSRSLAMTEKEAQLEQLEENIQQMRDA
ncbi:MAG: hypothetical protein AAGC73_05615 [Verrucomicrobiota bacterium]